MYIEYSGSALNITLRDSFAGLSFVVFIFCLSQHKDNGPESFCTMKFAKDVCKMRSLVTKPKKQNLTTLLQACQKQLVYLKSDFDNILPQKRPFRQLMINEQEF